MYGSEALELFIKENKQFCDRLSGCSQDGENSRSVNGDDNHNDDEIKKTASGIALEDFTYYSSSTHKLNCNWKVTLLQLTVLTVDRWMDRQIDRQIDGQIDGLTAWKSEYDPYHLMHIHIN